MVLVWRRLGVLCLFGVSTTAAQEVTHPSWRLSQMTDTLFTRPSRIRVDRTDDRVFVADTWRRSIVVLDLHTGAFKDFVGREGDGPGEFRSVSELAIDTHRGTLVAYDLARRSFDVFTLEGSFRFRSQVPTSTFNPKDLLIVSDSSWYLAGALRGVNDMRPARLVTTTGDSVVATSVGPVVLGEELPDNAVTRQARGVVSGGEFARGPGRKVFFAESATGHVFDIESGERVAEGPGAVPDLISRAVQSGPRSTTFWWTYPKAIYLEALRDGTFLMVWSERDSESITFYHLARGRTPRAVGTVTGIPAKDVDLAGPQTFAYIAMDSEGISTVGRHPLPPEVQRLLAK